MRKRQVDYNNVSKAPCVDTSRKQGHKQKQYSGNTAESHLVWSFLGCTSCWFWREDGLDYDNKRVDDR